MELKNKMFFLKGKVQNYAWGGNTFLPELIAFKNNENKPCAEYWMGAHPSASSVISNGNESYNLNELIATNPTETITNPVLDYFGELPYLFKILDVHDMLSIQVHPSKTEAAKGFDAENEAGIPLNAFNRNYKDKNHKPEVMVALSEFWLLHGFKEMDKIEAVLHEVFEFNILLPIFRKEGLKGMYEMLMTMDQEAVDGMLRGVVKKELRKKANNELTKADAGWWVSKLYNGVEVLEKLDRGIFSIYFFNIVGVQKGDAIFQAAGVPHAYLEGQNVELMANSDNVLRGGLTPKHIDVPELMKHTIFEPIVPNIMKGVDIGNYEWNYPCPVPDFGLNRISLEAGQTHDGQATSLEIIIAIQGGVVINSNSMNAVLKQGEAVAILPNEAYSFTASGNSLLFKAFVPPIH
jgi:mannose-6-phosphate isomerase